MIDCSFVSFVVDNGRFAVVVCVSSSQVWVLLVEDECVDYQLEVVSYGFFKKIFALFSLQSKTS